jgi:glycosyltransferase involved in cell wall biosynthesis
LPEVSAIIITRNRSRVLGRAIKSILVQTFTDFELIIVDGASDDETDSVVASFSDPRIRYIKLDKNPGPAKSLNYGFTLCRAPLIGLLDDDDEWLPSKLEKQISLIHSLPDKVGMVYCWMEFFDDRDNHKIREARPDARGDVFLDTLEHPVVGGAPSMLIRKKVIDKIGGWDESINLGADWQFSMKLAKHFEVDYVPEILVRVHVNHEYNRMTLLNTETLSQRDVVVYHQKILDTYKDDFNAHPLKKAGHLFIMGSNLAEMKAFSEYLRCAVSMFTIAPFEKKTYRLFMKGLARFLSL